MDESNTTIRKEIQIFKEDEPAPIGLSCIYVYEIEDELVKCGCTTNAKKRRGQLHNIRRNRLITSNGRFAVLPIRNKFVQNAEKIFFKHLHGRQGKTELFSMSFADGVKSLEAFLLSEQGQQMYLSEDGQIDERVREVGKQVEAECRSEKKRKRKNDAKKAFRGIFMKTRWALPHDTLRLHGEKGKMSFPALDLVVRLDKYVQMWREFREKNVSFDALSDEFGTTEDTVVWVLYKVAAYLRLLEFDVVHFGGTSLTEDRWGTPTQVRMLRERLFDEMVKRGNGKVANDINRKVEERLSEMEDRLFAFEFSKDVNEAEGLDI